MAGFVRVVERGRRLGRVRPRGARAERYAGRVRVHLVHEITLYEEGRPMPSFLMGAQVFAGPPNIEVGEETG